MVTNYHDKGEEKAEGVVDGLQVSGIEFEVIHTDVADYDY